MKPLIAILFCVGLGCSDVNEQAAALWLREAKKPVVIKVHVVNGWDYSRKYTMIAADGDVYNTGWVAMTLPDTVK